jgi:hypothetical protein
MRFQLKDVRIAFPNLFKATAPAGGGEAAFSASFLFPPNHPQIKAINEAITAVAKEKWGVKADAILKALKAADKTCLHNGDAKSDYEGFEGNLYISARAKVRPTAFDGQRNEISESDGLLLSGNYVNASLEFWAQDNAYGKRINAQLRGVQHLRKGEVFSGGGSPADADDFDEISAEGTDGSDSPSDADLTA